MAIHVKDVLLGSVFLFSLFVIFCSITSTSNRQIIAQEGTMGSSANKFLTFENFNYGIKISYPASWACNSPPSSASSQSLIIILCPPRENIDRFTIHSMIGDILAQKNQSYLENKLNNTLGRSASLAIWVFPSFNQPLDSYVNDKIKELQSPDPDVGAPNFTLVVSPQPYVLGVSIPAYEFEYTFMLNGQEKKVMTILTIKDSKAYEFLYLSDPSIYSTYLPVAQSIVNSFEFTSQRTLAP